jgi:hypothetical protein
MKNTLIILLLSFSVYAQKGINNYKYIMVPIQMEIFNKSDKYQTSSLAKFLFNKNGFRAFLNTDDLPYDLAQNKCLALTAGLEEGSGMFSTKLTLVLKNCYNEVIFRAEEGRSKIKEYKRAYQEALRKSFSSIKRLNYHYKPDAETKKSVNLNVSVNRNKNIETVKKKKPKLESTSIYDVTAERTLSGYKLKDNEGKFLYELLTTSDPNVFIIKDKNGVLLKSKQGLWSAQFYNEGILHKEIVKVEL